MSQTNEWIYAGLGVIYSKEKRYQEAAGEFLKALEINPSYDVAYRQLRTLFASQRKMGEPIHHLETLSEMNPETEASCFELGLIYVQERKYDEAVREFRKVLEISPSHGGAFHQLGRIYKIQGKIGEAKIQYEKAVELNPEMRGLISNSVSSVSSRESMRKGLKSSAKFLRSIPRAPEPTSNWQCITEIRGGSRKQGPGLKRRSN